MDMIDIWVFVSIERAGVYREKLIVSGVKVLTDIDRCIYIYCVDV